MKKCDDLKVDGEARNSDWERCLLTSDVIQNRSLGNIFGGEKGIVYVKASSLRIVNHKTTSTRKSS